MDIVKILIVVILAAVMLALAWRFLRRKATTASTGFYTPPTSATRSPLQQGGKPEKKAAAPPPPPAPIPSQPEQAKRAEKEEKVETRRSMPVPAAPVPPEAMPAPADETALPDWLADVDVADPAYDDDELLEWIKADDAAVAWGGAAPETPAEPEAEYDESDLEDSVRRTSTSQPETPAEPEAEYDESDLLDDVIRFRAPNMPAPEPQPVTEVAKPGAPSRRDEAAMQDLNAVHFSAYYPREVKPKDWQPLKAYLFRRFMADKVAEDAQAQLGERLPGFRKVMSGAAQPVAEGALVTATPELPGFQVNPPSMTVGFYKDMHRFDFELRATDAAPLHQATNGTVTFTVEGVVVGDVPLSVFVGETAESSPAMTSAETRLYQAIFCSYSHDDTTIVERVERAYKALGLDYLRDVMTLKAGQDWSAELLNLIEQADIFQLFWSRTAAASPHVRYEWEHALKIAARREKFIRPVYWEQPMPDVPPELGHIHFAYQPDLKA
jgi:hypothetical protein